LSWNDLQGIPADFADGVDNDTILSESEVENYVTNGALDLAEGTTIGGKDLQEAISEFHSTLKANDKRIDILENGSSVTSQRLDILAKMNSPENLRRDHIAMAELTSSVMQLRKEMDHQLHIHNGKHIPVANERVGT